MQIRQSDLTKFGDSLARFMREAGENDPDVKCSLDYMHSTYDGKKVLTFISPETGGMLLVILENPLGPMRLLITATRIVPTDTRAWHTFLLEEDLGIRGKHNLAIWLVNVFKAISYLDDDTQFVEKMTLLQREDATDLGLRSMQQGGLTTFYPEKYHI